jgi:hypothetical protein
MVDRICAEKVVSAKGNIAIETEEHVGSIVMLEPPKGDPEDMSNPLDGENVLVPEK